MLPLHHIRVGDGGICIDKSILIKQIPTEHQDIHELVNCFTVYDLCLTSAAVQEKTAGSCINNAASKKLFLVSHGLVLITLIYYPITGVLSSIWFHFQRWHINASPLNQIETVNPCAAHRANDHLTTPVDGVHDQILRCSHRCQLNRN